MKSLNTLYYKIYQGLLAAGAISFFIMLLKPASWMAVLISSIGILACALFMLYYAIMLLRSLPNHAPLFLSLVGLMLIASGAIVDMTVTIICSPDLSREANPIIIMLLNFGLPLWLIYLFALIQQILYISFTGILWICFLRIYPNIVRSIPYKNLFTTLKWLGGCGKMNLLDCILGRKTDFYFLISSISFMFSMLFIYRWYVAMEWLKIVPALGAITSIIGMICISTTMLTLITHYKIKQNKK